MKNLTLLVDLSASLYIGLLDGRGRCLASRIRDQGWKGESAHGLFEECLKEAGAAPADLSELCVGTGPGSFTGIRVGVAMVQGLAFPRRLPIHPFSSLSALLACAQGGGEPALAVIAANAGRYFTGVGRPTREVLMSAAEMEAQAGSFPRLITSGQVPDRERFSHAFASLTRLEDVMDFAKVWVLAMAGPPVRDGVIRPNYLMASAAEEKRRPAADAPSPEAAPPAKASPAVTPVRPMAREDIPAVLAIEAETNPLPWSRGDFLTYLPSPEETRSGGALLAGPARTDRIRSEKMAWVWADPQVRGFACVAGVADELELQGIAVNQADWGCGIASGLLRALSDWALDRSYRTLHLEVREGNTRGQALYRKFGFAQTGRRAGYYGDSGEDALLLSKTLC